MFQCHRCLRIFNKKQHLTNHIHKKNRCDNIVGKLKQSENRKTKQKKIKQLQMELEHRKSIEQLQKELDYHKTKEDIIEKLITYQQPTNIINNYVQININQSVAFGEETSDHITMDQLMNITKKGHPKGTVELLKEIYGHKDNKGTILVKNKRKGLFYVSNGKGGYDVKDKEYIKNIASQRIAVESRRVLQYIKKMENNNFGSIVDTHQGANFIVINMMKLKKSVGDNIYREMIRTVS